jgi:hypothetical protein
MMGEQAPELTLNGLRKSAFGKWCQDSDAHALGNYFLYCMSGMPPSDSGGENMVWALCRIAQGEERRISGKTIMRMVQMIQSEEQ